MGWRARAASRIRRVGRAKRAPPLRLLGAVVACGMLSAACPPVLAADALGPSSTAGGASSPIRTIEGKRLTLLTDLAPAGAVDELPAVFDKAFPQWCAYFGVPAARHADWHATGRLMKDKELFLRLGLLPRSLPAFENGFSFNLDLWVYDQPSDYYRRHLLLHEGVHSFMNTVLSSCGPPWYMEGMAELLGTHRWKDGRIELGWFPAHRDDVPMWGRIKIVRDAFAARRAKRLADVLNYDPRTQPGVEAYGWCWAAAAFLDGHPRYRSRFRTLPKWVRQPDFNERFRRLMGDDWDGLAEAWQVFVADLEYGYDLERTAMDFTPGKPLGPAGARVTIQADRGWQNTGIALAEGAAYRLRAAGRYHVADRPQIWWCEPNGVSIRYYHGRPLGILLAAVRPERPAPGPSPFIAPLPVGLGTDLTPNHAGTLYLRINDSGAELHDNAGTLGVEIREQGLGARG